MNKDLLFVAEIWAMAFVLLGPLIWVPGVLSGYGWFLSLAVAAAVVTVGTVPISTALVVSSEK
jgi:hypothetical protein